MNTTSVASALNLILSPKEFGKSGLDSIVATAVAGVPTYNNIAEPLAADPVV